ncbi:MAG: hypothetical protein ACF788_13630 [Novipirellula sp. JB048]
MMRFAPTMIMIGGIFIWTAAPGRSADAEEATILKIEEDWEMSVNEPNPASHAPQVTFFTTPTEDPDRYFQVQFNHAVDTHFSGGGFNVAAVEHERVVDSARSETRAALVVDGGRIRWTHVLADAQGELLFAIKEGHAEEWGEFGGRELLVRLSSDAAVGLSQYHPQKSLDGVDIGLGANRVASITLLEVRVFYDDGRVVAVPVNRHP